MKHLQIAPGGEANARAPKALLVPGNDLCAEFYVPLAHALKERGVRTTLLTMGGYHGQPPPAGGIEWAAYVDDVSRAIARHLDGGGTLIGHSMGGLLAFLAAARRPAEVERLVLLEPALIPWRAVGTRATQRYLRDVVSADAWEFSNWTGSFLRVADLDAFPKWAILLHLEVKRSVDRFAMERLWRSFEGLYPLPFATMRTPTLLVRGARSGWRGRLLHRAIAARVMAPIRRTAIADAGHWLANEQDEALAEEIAGFTR